MYDDTMGMSTPNGTTPLDTTQSTHSILGLNGETATEYSDDTPSEGPGTVEGLSATSGQTQSTRVLHKPTHTH